MEEGEVLDALGHVTLLGIDEVIGGQGDLLEDLSPVGGGDKTLAKAETEGVLGAGRGRMRTHRGGFESGRASFHLWGGGVHESRIALAGEEIKQQRDAAD